MHVIANPEHAEAWNGPEGMHWAQHAGRYDAMAEGINDPLLAAAAIGERDRVLDIGCGTGRVTRLAARLAPLGHVTGIDLSAPMVERAWAAMADEGIANVEFELGDAQVYPFRPGGYDVAISRGGFMFFGDLSAAFANIGRALRPGGRIAFAGPGPTDPNGDSARAFAALTPLLRSPSPAQRGMFSLTDPDHIREVFGDAGFTKVAAEPVEVPVVWGRDADDAAAFYFSLGPIRANLADVDPAIINKVHDEVRSALADFQTPQGISMRGAIWMITAVWPGGADGFGDQR
jgi:SAM-dependent methyltransferase